MITLKIAVKPRKVRTDEAIPYRLNVSEVLPHIDPAKRLAGLIWARLNPLRVEVRDGASRAAHDLLRLTNTQSTYGLRWWIVCSKCGGKCSYVYWVGYEDYGRWACWKCVGLSHTAAALRRTPEGDRLILSGEMNATRRTREAARQRERQRYKRTLKTLAKRAGQG